MRSLHTLRGCRVAFVMRDLGVGGAERQATLLARHLAQEHGAEVEFWCFDDFGRNRQTLLEVQIPIHHLAPGVAGGVLQRRLQLVRFVHKARRRRPELLLPFTDYPNKVCCSLWPLLGAKAAVWNQRDEGRERTERPLERLAVHQASFFICNSRAGLDFLHSALAVSESRTIRIPNGVVLTEALHSAATWRARLEIREDQSLVVMVGNLHRFKDHHTLLRAWRMVLDRSSAPAPVLALAGRHDTTHEELKELAAQLKLGRQLRFLGQIDDVSGLLNAAQLAVHSSYREGCPNGILEPMAAGLAVVATDIEGAREALGDQYPQLVPAENPEALADAICGLLADFVLRQDLAAANLGRVRRYFDSRRNFDRYAEVVSAILAGRNPSPVEGVRS